MDNENNKELTNDLNETVIVKESGADKPYKLEDASIEFDVVISGDGELIFKGGQLTTSYFIRNTELDNLETWRYLIEKVKIKGMHISTKEDKIVYEFAADSFVDYTVKEEDDG